MAVAKTSNSSIKIDKALMKAMAAAFSQSALPGENEGFDAKACEEAAHFTLQLAHKRKAGVSAIALDSFADAQGRLVMRIAMNNDDMPFLVDSISSCVAANGIGVKRIIHPVLGTTRDDAGILTSINHKRDASDKRESFIYLETDRVDAKERRALKEELLAVLRDVRGAVTDWRNMLGAMSEDAGSLPDGEGAALVSWFLDNNMTVLGHENLATDGTRSSRLGLSRVSDEPLLSEDSVGLAIKWFEEGGRAPLVLKANRVSSVHRHVQLDLVVVPICSGSKITGVSLTAGLWTSAALATAPDRIPVLRTHLANLMERFGFDPSGHAGKAMTHALTSLPHDLLVSLKLSELERVTLTAMSLNDRPRPKLLAIRSPLGRHLYIFVWLPRDDVSTGMRKQIENMLVEATGGALLSWSISLEDGGVALLRYTLDLPDRYLKVDEEKLGDKLELMVRGWEPAVESALARLTDDKRAAAMVVRYASAFPASYRNHYSTDEAARDMIGLLNMERDHSRVTRLSAGGDHLRLKVYSAGGAMPLSHIVPALENFGFDVLEESPTALGDSNYIHDFRLALRGGDVATVMERALVLEGALSQVLDGHAENDVFNQLVTIAGLDPQAVIWLRAWYRYLRQTGVAYGMPTIVAALAKNSSVTRAIISLFAALHDPAGHADREK
ncbi:MAG: glutamate dehydrogenase, partial [Sphingorhabdus sp.]